MRMNGIEGQPSIPAMPFPGDYSAAFYAFGMTLAALLKRQETGRGESIDVAQFETMMRIQSQYPIKGWTYGEEYVKEGTHSLICALYGTYVCNDCEEVYVLFLGPGVLKAGLPLLGLEYASELFPEGEGIIPYGSHAGDVAEEAFANFLAQHTSEEVETILNEAGVPCSRLMNYEQAAADPHYQARGVIETWPAVDGMHEISGVKVVPDLANYPGRVWRGAPCTGQDNDDILTELGFSSDAIAEMYECNLLGKKSYKESFAN